jgi:predicted nucleic acid-binding protein
MSNVLLFDNSAWSRLWRPELTAQRCVQIADWMDEGLVGTCLPFLLEAGYSARSASDHLTIMAGLARMPRVPISAEVERHALQAQEDLARAGHHRMHPVDVMIAACAHESDSGVLHYDHDYDLLRKHTRLRFRSEWLAPAGTLD